MINLKAQRVRLISGYTVLFLLLIALALLNICAGSADITISRLRSALAAPESDKVAYNIITQLRFPRTAAAAILGGALAVSGFLLQSHCRSIYTGYFLGSKADCCSADGAVTVTGICSKFHRNDMCRIYRSHAVDGHSPYDIRAGKAYVRAYCLRSHDRIYLLISH